MSLKIGIVLAGCGVYDGSEIYETTLTLLHLAKHNAQVTCFAPSGMQREVTNHLTGAATDETRNILVESARLARGEVQELTSANPATLDALIFPGGFGGAKNLSNLAFVQDPAELQVHPEVDAVVNAFHQAGKPLGFICITPASVAAPALHNKNLQLTIGSDTEMASVIEACGHTHINCRTEDIVVDAANRITTTPAYMTAQSILEAEAGISKLVAEVCQQAQQLQAAA